MTKEEAKQECIKKWTYIVNNDGSVNGLLHMYPEVANYIGYCAYCELYWKENCSNCPIRGDVPIDYKHMCCFILNHPYYRWLKDKTKANAQAVLDLILKS